MTETLQTLTHHWAMDTSAAETLAEQMDDAGEKISLEFDPIAVAARDRHRSLVGDIFTRRSAKGLILVGPCSLDMNVDYEPLFDFVEELQEQNPDALIAMRANGAKPRTGPGWKGLWYGNVEERERLFEIYNEAFTRHIPLITEVTENSQIGALAPWLSGMWVGARDVESTALRGTLSAIHLPLGIKNGRDGSVGVLAKAIQTVRASSSDNNGSGADIGTIASNPHSRGIPTGILPIGEGNSELAIFARGYELPKEMDPEERRKKAIEHLSAMCMLGAEAGTAVLIDGSHSVPPMLDISRQDPDRFLAVLGEIHTAIEKQQIKNATQIAGVLGEVGPELGRTDQNLLLDDNRKKELSRLVATTIKLLP